MLRPLTNRQLAFDIGFAAVCVFLRLGPFGLNSILEFLFVSAMGAALATRRLTPGIALGVAWVGVILQMAGLFPPDLANLAILPVLYATAAYGSLRVRTLGLVSAGGGSLVGTLYIVALPLALTNGASPASFELGDLPLTVLMVVFVGGAMLALLGLSWTLGLLARTRATARESREAQKRAEEEEREARRLAVVEQERNRIARDMHDVVAHSLAVVIAQADGARYAITASPSAAEEALTTIATTAREALTDVRVLLAQLRHSQGEGPQPGLGDLERLIGQMTASGLEVRTNVIGAPRQLAASQQIAVYRIVQEALTNALRHGDADKPVDVGFEWGDDGVVIRVVSALTRETAPPSTDEGGHGLAGMRERALLVGGRLTVEPRDATFIVDAFIPAPNDRTTTPQGATDRA